MERTEADLLADSGAARPDEEMDMETSGISLLNFKSRPSGALLRASAIWLSGAW